MKKRKIIIDIDDTIVKTSEQIIKILNKQNNTNKTIKDYYKYDYSDIKPGITHEEILKLYDTEWLYKTVEIFPGFAEFLTKFKKEFTYVFVSRGTKDNLAHKHFMLDRLMNIHEIKDWEFIQLPIHDNKNSVRLNDVYLAIDDNAYLLTHTRSPKKILFQGDYPTQVNQIPINSDYYAVNNWYQIIEMIDFDLMLYKEGIYIG